MLGMDLMIKTVVKSLGLDPETFPQQVEGFLRGVAGKVMEFEKRIAAMEEVNHELVKQNAEFIAEIRHLRGMDYNGGNLITHKETENQNG